MTVDRTLSAHFVRQLGGPVVDSLNLQTGATIEMGLQFSRPSSATFPIAVNIGPDGAPRFTGDVNVDVSVASVSIPPGFTKVKVMGFRPGPVRLNATVGGTLLGSCDIQVQGKELSGMTVLDALDGYRLLIPDADAKVLRDSIKGSKTVGVDPIIIDLLAALLRRGTVGVMSLLRPGQEQHGVLEGGKMIARAVDLNMFQGRNVVSTGRDALVSVVCDMLTLFPAGDFDLGLTRPVGGHGFDHNFDVFFVVDDQATADACFAGKIARTLSQMLQPARDSVSTAMQACDATFHLLYPDGLDHLHVGVTRTKDMSTRVF
jgi:hypothetical protein